MQNIELELAEDFVKNTNKNIFLTGRAGTGKTTFLKNIVKTIKKKNIVVAPTGVAAINAQGVTIHSMFQVPFTAFIPSNDPVDMNLCNNRMGLLQHMKYRGDRRKLLENLELLIIDEISMVRCDLLDAIDFILKTIRKDQSPFGGVQLLVIGDLFQLSPVVKSHIWPIIRPYYNSPFFFEAHGWRLSNPIKIELKKIYRQKEDTFIDILNNVRLGIKNTADIDKLNANFDPNPDEKGVLTLTTHNFKADKINDEQMLFLTTKEFRFSAEIKGIFKESAFPTNHEIVLKEGAQVMFIRNHADGDYFNGKIGTIIKITNKSIRVHFEEENDSIDVEREEWKNTKYSVNKTSKEIEQETVGSFSQYPLRLAWAITIHKSQGLTFDKINLDLSKSFAPGQMYVALSRCRTLDGIKLNTKVEPRNIIVDKSIISYYEREDTEDAQIDELLKEAKDKFSHLQMIDAFKITSSLNMIEEWKQVIVEKKSPFKIEALNLQKALVGRMNKIIQTSYTFQTQLTQMGNKEEENLENILNRAKKAIEYFTNTLHKDVILILERHYGFIKSKTGIKPYIRFMKEMIGDVWFQIEKLYNIEFEGKIIFDKPPEHKRVILFDAKEPAKIDTRVLTLELFNSGRSIEEIAKARSLKTGTIETHLGDLLKQHKVKLSQLIEKEKRDILIKYMKESKTDELAEQVKNSPIETSFHELRWVRSFLSFEKKD